MSIIRVSGIGLRGKDVFLAHERGEWGPERLNSDWRRCQLNYDPSYNIYYIDGEFLGKEEEFKLIVPVESEEEALERWKKRISYGVHVGHRFDFDKKKNTFWLLSPIFPVVRFGEWNQNNVYRCTEDEKAHYGL